MTTIKEIEKGCGERYYINKMQDVDSIRYCGQWSKWGKKLCSKCKRLKKLVKKDIEEAKLQTKKEDLEIIRKLLVKGKTIRRNDIKEVIKLIEGKQEEEK